MVASSTGRENRSWQSTMAKVGKSDGERAFARTRGNDKVAPEPVFGNSPPTRRAPEAKREGAISEPGSDRQTNPILAHAVNKFS